jgi:hypothetical protein
MVGIRLFPHSEQRDRTPGTPCDGTTRCCLTKRQVRLWMRPSDLQALSRANARPLKLAPRRTVDLVLTQTERERRANLAASVRSYGRGASRNPQARRGSGLSSGNTRVRRGGRFSAPALPWGWSAVTHWRGSHSTPGPRSASWSWPPLRSSSGSSSEL